MPKRTPRKQGSRQRRGTPPKPPDAPAIRVRGARQNNLKGFDVSIPHERLTVITGVSGSGKSSLAFQTLYAEGQRRYSESFSAYVRQFLERLPRPRADTIEGMLPAIAIEQQASMGGGRSTVATMTDLADYLKLLFARGGTLHCPDCGEPVQDLDATAMRDLLLNEQDGRRAVIAFPVALPGADSRWRAADAEAERYRQAGLLRQMGFTRCVRVDGWSGEPGPLPAAPEVVDLDAEALAQAAAAGDAYLFMVADRLLIEPARGKRLLEALEQGLDLGNGPLAVLLKPPGADRGRRRKRAAWQVLRLGAGLRCRTCDRTFERPSPNLFSYNTPVGACETCGGFGRVMDIDWDLVIPDGKKTLAEGAIRPWTTPKTVREREHLAELCEAASIPMDVPWQDLPAPDRELLTEGEADVWGVKDWFDWLETRTYRTHVRILLSRYRAYRTCPDCRGARLTPEALAYRVGGKTLADVYRLDVGAARRFFGELQLPGSTAQALMPVLREIRTRLGYLEQVGVEYLTLDRPARTLSGGEAQRVTLTTALGASLVHTLFVLDEPTVGLHPRDTDRLNQILSRLVAHGNTVVVVEHDPDVIRQADHLVDLGPGAGEAGGELLYSGPPEGLAEGASDSLTAALLARPGRILGDEPPRRTGRDALRIEGATAHNLQDLDVEIPLGTLTCVTGVSGSGKSTLVEHVLHRGVARRLGRPMEAPGAHRGMTGWEELSDVVFVDQSPAAASPRATPLTYVGVFDRVRQLFARTPEARARGFTPGTFSFNTAGGRCEECEGTGVVRVELHFLPDALVPCEVCEGRRYTDDVLRVRWRGRTIRDVLDLTVTEALALFEGVPKVVRGLSVLAEVGLGYLRLGQGLNTLSGGEAQRLKVARHLALEKTTGGLFLLDEPTRGLHLADVGVLISALHRLVERGNTVVVIEHHPEVIWQADHVLDLGPEGGAAGGRIVAQGPPESIRRARRSHTGRFLSAYLAADSARPKPASRAKETTPPYGAPPATAPDEIRLVGAREHNLRDLTLTIPRDQLVVLTGPSGSGKSSVAFDILHAEGQRRFLDCLSPFARQYMQQLARPDIAALQGVPPTIAVEQRLTRGRRMSTVATVTEIYPYLRLLFAKAGRQLCLACGEPTTWATAAELVQEVLSRFLGRRLRLLAPLVRQRKGWHQTVLERARQLGLAEIRVDGKLRPLQGRGAPQRLARYRLHDVDYVLAHETVGRGPEAESRWRELVQQALDLGGGHFSLLPAPRGRARKAPPEVVLGTARICRDCGVAYEPPDPRLFSFTTAQGACEDCDGTGVDEDGEVCSACAGTRLRDEAHYVTLDDHRLADVHALRPADALAFLRGLDLGAGGAGAGSAAEVVTPLRAELEARLLFLETVGLGYLQLDRSAATLSGGEIQRLRLAAHLSAPLHGVLYILDEPTIGLHPADHDQLLQVLKGLRRARNTVLIVEHDEETMRAADHLIDLGPGGGRDGGRLVDAGPPRAVEREGVGLTAQLLRGEVGRAADNGRPAPDPMRREGWVRIEGAAAHNLQRLRVRIPTGALSVITGRSGSGKSTLLEHVLLASAHADAPVGCTARSGLDAFDRVVQVDQEPIGRNPRSCPATYVGLMTRLRERFAALPESRVRGFKANRFSFNVAGGRCPECQGHGWLKVEMGFLPDAHVRCPRCQGQRYHRDTLAIRMQGRSIADVLAMNAAEAAEVLSADPRLRRTLQLFVDIGLGYLPLGQPSPTLSGGEAQRVKLIQELGKRSRGATLYLLDEPTTGLHGADVERLLGVLHRLVERGHTVVLIEHHLRVIAAADWVLDLGPGAGPDGGRLLYQGPPGPLGAHPDRFPQSATARWLARHLRAS